jgi:hypothetical protein
LRVRRQTELRQRPGKEGDALQEPLLFSAHVEGAPGILASRLSKPQRGERGIDVMNDRLREDQALVELPHALDHALRGGIEPDLANRVHRVRKHLLKPRSLDGARQPDAGLGALAALACLEIDCHEELGIANHARGVEHDARSPDDHRTRRARLAAPRHAIGKAGEHATQKRVLHSAPS